MAREAREIWCVRSIGWTLVIVGVGTVARSWLTRDPATGLWGPIPDFIPFALITGAAFDLIGRVLMRMRTSAKPGAAST